ncbi:MAG TPA: NAD(P)/FAD-dependent oxidoreductase [Clostridia bacterium]
MKSNAGMENNYDAVIIGAGIGGLICGNYLAQNGMKTLIVEQHFQPGGCCTSFKRKGFTFDAGGHFVGGLRENGSMRKILEGLDIDCNKIFTKLDPADFLIFPDFSVKICGDENIILDQITELFPHQAGAAKKFFEEINSFNYTKSYLYKDMTFMDVLNRYFEDEKLKAVFDILVMYIGLVSNKVSAVAAIILFREFILDGGYYPKGGMQSLADTLAEKFQGFGGELLLSSKAEKITLSGKKCSGIVLEDGREIRCKYVISNIDAHKTFVEMVGKEHISEELLAKLNQLELSVSHFVVYLGINSKASDKLMQRCNTWYIPGYDIRKIYNEMLEDPLKSNGFVHAAFPSFYDNELSPKGCESIFLTVLAPFKTLEFWKEAKEKLASVLIGRAENIMEGLSESIVLKEYSTPQTILRYTGNSDGANYGWSMIPSQSGRLRLKQETEIDGLYLAGHWTQPGCGIATVAQSGFSAARMVLLKNRVFNI